MVLDETHLKYITPVINLESILSGKYDKNKHSDYLKVDISKTFTVKHQELLKRIGGTGVNECAPGLIKCSHCASQVPLVKFRSHLAMHLLNVNDTVSNVTSSSSKSYCGFCGNEESDRCRVTLTSNKNNVDDVDLMHIYGLPKFKNKNYKYKIVTQCNAGKFNHIGKGYLNLMKYSKTDPCTNAPMSCFHEECNCTIWKYNIAAHFKDVHEEKSPGTTTALIETMEAVSNYKEIVVNPDHIKASKQTWRL